MKRVQTWRARVIAALYGKAYRGGKFEMKKAHKRDGDVFRFAVLFNNEILREPALRKLLEELLDRRLRQAGKNPQI